VSDDALLTATRSTEIRSSGGAELGHGQAACSTESAYELGPGACRPCAPVRVFHPHSLTQPPCYVRFSQLLAEQGLSPELLNVLSPALTLEDAVAEAFSNRVGLLARLKTMGIAKLAERQKLVNACSSACRLGRLEAAMVDGASQNEEHAQGPQAGKERIWALSDVHTDKKENMQWIKALRKTGGLYESDTLILAGDISDNLAIVRETLSHLVGTFRHVFFTPGNHDLWVRTQPGSGTASAPSRTSLDVLDDLLQLCGDLGVKTRPGFAAGTIVVPLLSWHHKSWDTEPELTGWGNIVPADSLIMDYVRCKWPAELDGRCNDDSIARRLDAMNDSLNDTSTAVQMLRALYPSAPVVTFSHFVPRIELFPVTMQRIEPGKPCSRSIAPHQSKLCILCCSNWCVQTQEKRYLFSTSLAKAVGSAPLRARVESLRPDCHVFGHTHFGWVSGASDLDPPPSRPLLARLASRPFPTLSWSYESPGRRIKRWTALASFKRLSGILWSGKAGYRRLQPETTSRTVPSRHLSSSTQQMPPQWT
jgi:hypothetical protein